MSNYDLASLIQNKEKVLAIRTLLVSAFEKNKLLHGAELKGAMSVLVDAETAESVVYFLKEEKIIRTLRPASNIDDYAFSIDESRISELDAQAVAAEILAQVNPAAHARKEAAPRIVSTFPEDPQLKRPAGVNLLYPALKRIIRQSSKVILIVNPYFDQKGMGELIPDLAAAAKRGCSIRIISREYGNVENTFVTNAINLLLREFKESRLLGKISVRDYYKKLKEHGDTVAIHSKLIICDEEAYIGSANLTSTGFYTNFEVGVTLSGEAVRTLQNLFESLWNASRTIKA